ncbi:MAG: hypothetical protein KDC12_08220 [Flavobacteriales bacterium]|nr:hypothetical protein [Flavobacteriales bacterium]
MSPKSFLTAAAFLFVFALSGFSQPLHEDNKEGLDNIRKHIVQELSGMTLENHARFEEEIRICFKLNSSGTIEVHEVQCDNEQLKHEVANELKDMRIETDAPLTDQLYWITVKFKVV